MVVHFKSNDGLADSNVSTLTITVTGTNDAPVAAAKIGAATEGGATKIGRASGRERDEGARVTYSVTDATPAAGLIFNADGSYSFDPAGEKYEHVVDR